PENGFDVARALVGSEGTCVVLLEAELRLVDAPRCRALALLGYRDVYEAADDVPNLMRTGPVALEGIDERLVQDMVALGMHSKKLKRFPEGRGWLIVEYGGATAGEAAERARSGAQASCSRAWRVFEDPAEQQDVWKVRESG